MKNFNVYEKYLTFLQQELFQQKTTLSPIKPKTPCMFSFHVSEHVMLLKKKVSFKFCPIQMDTSAE